MEVFSAILKIHMLWFTTDQTYMFYSIEKSKEKSDFYFTSI